jgi:hypothetical protein
MIMMTMVTMMKSTTWPMTLSAITHTVKVDVDMILPT